MKALKRHWVLFAGVAVLWITIAVLLLISLKRNDGLFIYLTDDAYIHMAIAKNLAEHGVWGVNRESFTSTSSSLLWTILLSTNYFLFGTRELTSFIMNIVSGTILIVVVYYLVRKFAESRLFIFGALLSMIFFTPMPYLIFGGLEHITHALLTILLAFMSARALSDDKSNPNAFRYSLALAPLVTMARYEGMFLILVISFLLFLRKRFFDSIRFFGVGLLPILLFGAVSVVKGWYFFPNSVFLKGRTPDLSSLSGLIDFAGYYGFRQMLANPHMMYLIIAALIIFGIGYGKEKKAWNHATTMVTIFAMTAYLHLQFAATGWVFRYEAYLVALGVFVLACGMAQYVSKSALIDFSKEMLPKTLAFMLGAVIILVPYIKRAALSTGMIPQATTNVYEQHYQMSMFVRDFYDGQTVAANDIGAINFFSDIHCLDLWGLASMEVAKAKKGDRYNSRTIHKIAYAKNTRIAIVYDRWFDQYGGLPPEWTIVGKWKIFNNVVCGQDEVTFCAVVPSETMRLVASLKAFSPRLAPGVKESGLYTK